MTTISVSLVESLSWSLHTTLYLQVKVIRKNSFTVAEGKKFGVPEMTRGGSTHSVFRIASTIVILRENVTYANV